MGTLKDLLFYTTSAAIILTELSVIGLCKISQDIEEEISRTGEATGAIVREVAMDLYFPVGINPNNKEYTNHIQQQIQNKVPEKIEYKE